MAKRNSDHRVAYPEVKVHVRDLVRVVDIVAPFAPRGQYSGKIRFIEPQGINGSGDLCWVPPAAVHYQRTLMFVNIFSVSRQPLTKCEICIVCWLKFYPMTA